MRVVRVWAALGGAILSAGCGAVPRDAGFESVQREVAARGGAEAPRVHWVRGGPEDRAVAAAVAEMLAQELTADGAVQIALLNNRALQASYEGLMVAQADLVAAGLLRNPIFSAEVRLVEGGGGPALELGLVQSFLDIFFIPLRQRIAGAKFEAARQRIIGEVFALSARTRAAYYQLQGQLQRIEALGQVVLATGASHELALRLREAGNITELDLAAHRAMHEQARVELAAAGAEALRRRERLNALMGVRGEQTRWTIPARLPDLPAREEATERAESLAVLRNLGLAAAEREIEAAAARLGIARPLASWGDAEAGAAAEREAGGTWSVGPAVAVPLPLFDGGQAARARAEAELRRAVQGRAALEVEVRAQSRAAHISLLAARARAEHYRGVLLPLRQRISEESMLRYNAMQIGTFELLQARREQVRAAMEWIDALGEYWLARAELEEITGGFTTGDPPPETPPPETPPPETPLPEISPPAPSPRHHSASPTGQGDQPWTSRSSHDL